VVRGEVEVRQMLKVGLTGGIGSGKSTVSNMFKDMQIPVIDSDLVAREVLNIYPQILQTIKEEFGEQFIDEKGELRRKELGSYVFEKESRKEKLDAIMIPFIKKEVYERLEQYNKDGAEICIVDAPTLIEHNINEKMDTNILVWVDRETQLERVKKRDLLDDREIANRINAQMSLDEKKKYVDFIIDNSKDIENTKHQFDMILKELKVFEG